MSRPSKSDQLEAIKVGQLVLRKLAELQTTGKTMLFLAPSWTDDAFTRQTTVSAEVPYRFDPVPDYLLLVEVTLADPNAPKYLSKVLKDLTAKGLVEPSPMPIDRHVDFATRWPSGETLYVRVFPLDNMVHLDLHANWPIRDDTKPLRRYTVPLGVGHHVTEAGLPHLQQEDAAPVEHDVPASGTFTPKQVAAKYKADLDTVYGWLKSGQLTSLNMSRKPGSGRPRYLIRQSDLDAFELKKATTPPAAPAQRKRRKVDPNVHKFF